MKRILFLIDSSLKANVRAYKTIGSLSKKYEVKVISRSEKPESFKFNNTSYIKLESYINDFFKRTIFLGNDFTKGIKSLDANSINNIDLVYAVDLWTLEAGKYLKEKFDVELIYDSYELCPYTIEQHYPSQKNPFKNLFFHFWSYYTRSIAIKKEKELLNSVDHLITTSFSYKDHFVSENNFDADKISVVMNCPIYQESIKKIDLHKNYNIPNGRKILLYIGWFNKGRHLEKLVKSADFFNPNIHLLVLGKGSIKTKLEELARDRSNVTIAGPFEMNETLGLIKGSDLGILLLEAQNKSKHLASANKIFDFLMAEKPMILSNSPENKFIADHSKLHFLIENISSKGIANEVNRLIEANIMVENTELNRLKTEFSWETQEKRLISTIDALLG